MLNISKPREYGPRKSYSVVPGGLGESIDLSYFVRCLANVCESSFHTRHNEDWSEKNAQRLTRAWQSTLQ